MKMSHYKDVMSPTLNVTMARTYSELEVCVGKLEYLYLAHHVSS